MSPSEPTFVKKLFWPDLPHRSTIPPLVQQPIRSCLISEVGLNFLCCLFHADSLAYKELYRSGLPRGPTPLRVCQEAFTRLLTNKSRPRVTLFSTKPRVRSLTEFISPQSSLNDVIFSCSQWPESGFGFITIKLRRRPLKQPQQTSLLDRSSFRSFGDSFSPQKIRTADYLASHLVSNA